MSEEKKPVHKLPKELNSFPAILEPKPCSKGFGVYFPDLPRAISDGENYEDAVANARECLELHLAGMLEDNYPVPKPSNIEEICRKLKKEQISELIVPNFETVLAIYSESPDPKYFDVKNFKSFPEFYKKRKTWISWFDIKTENSITSQIHQMMWDDTIFRSINEARRIKLQSKEDSVGINEAISELIDRGYVSLQATAVRGLIDSRSDVVSLGRLIRDIENNSHLITRENYVCVNRDKYIPEENLSDLKEVFCRNRHKTFDELSSTTEKNRNRRDVINPAVFPKLIHEVSKFEDLKQFANKFIAHKADPESLKSLTSSQKGFSLNQIFAHHIRIIQIARFIHEKILWNGGMGSLPTPQYNLFDNFDKPWIKTENLDQINEFWNQRKDDVDNISPMEFEPSQKTLVEKFLNWELVEKRLGKYKHIGEHYDIKSLKTFSSKGPFYCHYLAWRLGVWEDESLIQFFDNLLSFASSLENWKKERKSLISSRNFDEFFGLIWQLQIAKLFGDNRERWEIENIKWLSDGPDLEIIVKGKPLYVECYTYRKSFGLKHYIDEIFRQINPNIKTACQDYIVFNLPKNLETESFLDNLFAPYLDSQFLKTRAKEAKEKSPVLLPIPKNIRNFYPYLEGTGEFDPSKVPGTAGDPETFFELLIKETINSKNNSNKLNQYHPNLLAVNYLLIQDPLPTFKTGIQRALSEHIYENKNIDSIYFGLCGIDGMPFFKDGVLTVFNDHDNPATGLLE